MRLLDSLVKIGRRAPSQWKLQAGNAVLECQETDNGPLFFASNKAEIPVKGRADFALIGEGSHSLETALAWLADHVGHEVLFGDDWHEVANADSDNNE